MKLTPELGALLKMRGELTTGILPGPSAKFDPIQTVLGDISLKSCLIFFRPNFFEFWLKDASWNFTQPHIFFTFFCQKNQNPLF